MEKAAGSGSESAVMIKAIARGDNSTAREGIHTEASCSSRLGTTNQQLSEDQTLFPSPISRHNAIKNATQHANQG